MIDHRSGAHDEVFIRFFLIVIDDSCKERHRLVRFSKPHVVAKKARKSMAVKKPKPIEPLLLIGSECCFQPRNIENAVRFEAV